MWQHLRGMLVLIAVPTASWAAQQSAPQCSQEHVMVVLVEQTTLALSQTRTERIPYGRDLTVLIRTDSAVTSVSLAYEFTGGSGGPRSGQVEAVRDSTRRDCWAAAAPRVHLNETGSFTAVIAMPPRFNPRHSARSFTVEVLLNLAELPSPLSPEEFGERSTEGISQAISAAFATPAESLFVPAEDKRWVLLQTKLSELVVQEIQYTNVFHNVRNAARSLSSAVPAVRKAPEFESRSVPGCAVGESLTALQAAADTLRQASDTAIAQRIVDGALPWPSCVSRLVTDFPDSADFGRVARAVARLRESEELRELLRLSAEIRALVQQLARARTLEVPLGADLLERYTQVDIVSAYIPDEDVTQAFAAATWYFFNPEGDFTGKIQPEGWGAHRFGLQVGYPVGTLSGTESPFEPDILLGLIGRINGVLSLSAGIVFGKDAAGESKEPYFFSLNVDLSNLGPLQQLFSRPDK